MIGYTMIGTNNLGRAAHFYDSLFAMIGMGRAIEWQDSYVMWGQIWSGPMFGVTLTYNGNPATVGNGVMIALPLADIATVDSFHAEAVRLGAQNDGAPGCRGDATGMPGFIFYAAYFLDLDGNKICAYSLRRL
jgi:catechol 2,3-dioxygenase-like lactoylglutathione lyase family enzyme